MGKEPTKGIHFQVPEPFHQRVKIVCVMKKTTLKKYAIAALEEKVARDEAAMQKKGASRR